MAEKEARQQRRWDELGPLQNVQHRGRRQAAPRPAPAPSPAAAAAMLPLLLHCRRPGPASPEPDPASGAPCARDPAAPSARPPSAAACAALLARPAEAGTGGLGCCFLLLSPWPGRAPPPPSGRDSGSPHFRFRPPMALRVPDTRITPRTAAQTAVRPLQRQTRGLRRQRTRRQVPYMQPVPPLTRRHFPLHRQCLR